MLVDNPLGFRCCLKLDPEKAGIGTWSSIADRYKVLNPGGNRLNNLARERPGRVLLRRSQTRVIKSEMKHGMLSRGNCGKLPALPTNPNGLLRGYLPGVV